MTTEFKIIKDEDGEIVPCDCCNFSTATTIAESDRKYNLCQVCYCTFLSNAVIYPNQCKDTALYKSIAYLGNMILEKLNKIEAKLQ